MATIWLLGAPAFARPLQDSDLPIELRSANIAATLKAHKEHAWSEVGQASFYRVSRKFHRTASGELLNDHALTGASRSIPLGTLVKVTNLANDKSVLIRINDRLGLGNPRVLDLTMAGAAQLGILRAGTGEVEITAPNAAPVEVADAPDNLDPPIKPRAAKSGG